MGTSGSVPGKGSPAARRGRKARGLGDEAAQPPLIPRSHCDMEVASEMSMSHPYLASRIRWIAVAVALAVVAALLIAGAVVWSKRKPISMGDDAPASSAPSERISA